MTLATETAESNGADGAVDADVLAYFEKADAARPADADEGSADPAPAKKPAGLESGEAVAADADKAKAAEEAATKALAQRQEERRKASQEAEAKAREEAEKAQSTARLATFRGDPVGELRRMAKEIVGDDEKAIAAFLEEEVYTPLMVDLVGMKDPDKLDPNIKTRQEMRALNRKLEAEKAAREAEKAALQQEKQQAEEQVKLQQVKGTLSRWIEDKGSDYPDLVKYARNPADDLFDILLNDEEMEPEKAAELADAYYRKERERYVGASDQVRGGTKKKSAAGTATKVESATRTTSLTNSGATQGVAAERGGPPDDPDASAAYWADQLERNPDAVRQLVNRRR